MSKLERLGLLIAILLAFPTYLVAHQMYAHTFATVRTVEIMGDTKRQEVWNAIYLAGSAQNPGKFENCAPNTIEIRPYDDGQSFEFWCENDKIYATKRAIAWSVVPGIFLFTLGYLLALCRTFFERP